MTSQSNSVLYVGVSNDLERRVTEHKLHKIDGFTKKYNCDKLVYFEQYNDINQAITREKQLKNWTREWKNTLVNKENSNWNDLSSKWDFFKYKSDCGQANNEVTCHSCDLKSRRKSRNRLKKNIIQSDCGSSPQ